MELIKKQWIQKKFRIFILFMSIMAVILCIEWIGFQYGILKIIRYFFIFVFLGIIAWIDGNSRKIPNKLLSILILARGILLILEGLIYREYWKSILLSAVGGFLLGGGMFLLCYLVTRKGVGAGDVKLMAVLGAYMGMGTIFTTIFLTAMIAALYSIIMLLKKRTSLKQEIPFAPFVLAGTIFTMMLGV